MTVLVTGGTGFLGACLVRRLLTGGARVRVLVRAPMKAKPLAAQGAETVVGDITDRAAVTAALDDVALVYHLAGRLLLPGVPATEYHRTHVEGTKLLLACCQNASRLERFVHCSTTGVLGPTGDRPADETAPYAPSNIYETTKTEAELAVRDARRAGFPAVIARPGLVYGPGDLHLLAFFSSVLRGWFRPIGRRTVSLHPIYIDDLTEALVRCGEGAGAVGECFHIAGREPVSLAEFAAAIAHAGGNHLPPGHIPLGAARTLAALGDLLPPGLKRLAPLTSSRLEFLTHSRVYDVTKARRLLDFSAPTALPDGVAQTLAWYREQGYLATDASVLSSWRVARAS
jgi:nucleoside-diphosphate-sugar epimerase